MKAKKTKLEVQLERITAEIIKYCDDKEAAQTRSAESFDEISKHFCEAVNRFGRHLAGCKATFRIIASRNEPGSPEILTILVKGKFLKSGRMHPVKTVLKSKDPANFIMWVLWDCIGHAKGIFKNVF
jgi:hypothetical protein